MNTYRFSETYEDNYQKGPVPVAVPPLEANVPAAGRRLFGLPLRSPLGIFSGPLLNSKWVAYYAALGYDVLVYKTVRSHACPSHEWPNCARVSATDALSPRVSERPASLQADRLWSSEAEVVSMTNSYGMPSRPPVEWQADVAAALASLGAGQMLIVSVVGDDLADYAATARMAREAGAHAIELNLSCPNVLGREGSLFLDPAATALVCETVSEVVHETPLLVKFGYIEDSALLDRMLSAVEPFVAGVSGINTIPMEIRDAGGVPVLGSQRLRAGVCGDIIRDCGLDFAGRVARWRTSHRAKFALLAGGGIMAPEHVDQYLATGAEVAMMATAVMVNPALASRYLSSHLSTRRP